MADNTLLNTGSGGNTIRTLEDGSSIHWPAGVCAFATSVGTPDVLSVVTPTAGLPVHQQTGATWTVTGTGGTFPVTDSGGSLTVDAPVGTPVFVRLSDGSAAIATLPVSGPLTDAQLRASDVPVSIATPVTVTQASAWLIDGQAAHDAPVSGSPVTISARASAAAPTDVSADNDVVRLWSLRNGSLVCNLAVAGTLVTGSAGLPAAQQGTWNIGTVTTVTTCSTVTSLTQFNGNAIATNTGVVSAGTLRVTLATDVALPTGTNSIGQVTCNAGTNLNTSALALESGGNLAGAATSLAVMDDWDNAASDGASVSGDVAHDSADAGEPVKLGAKAESGLSGITLVADGDRTNLHAGLDGVLIVRNHTNMEDVVSERTTNTDGASTAFASGLAAPGANIYLRITAVTICNSSASFCTVDLRDGSAGSVLWTLPVPATGGVVQIFDPPLKLSANTALAFDASAATTTLTISANGFKSRV